MRARLAMAVASFCLSVMVGAPAFAALAPEPREEPVLITADSLEYDQEKGIVKASGNVEVSRRTGGGIVISLSNAGQKMITAPIALP